jgi:WXXGXW repeat (2 copies)
MRYLRLPILCGVALLIAAFVSAEEPIATPEPEILTRGPIHEAYAASMNLSPAAGQIAPKAPPENIDELPPDQRPEGDNVQWIPGYFAWDEERTDFLWVSGFWRQPPPGRQWVPGGWRQTAGGWQWTSGFWADANHTQVEYVPQPPAPLETAASVPAPADMQQSTFVPGTWVYYETRYRWRPGFWLGFRPNWVYVPAHYSWTPCGYVFVDGYWDYPLRQRGIIFAPVYFGVGIYARPMYVYRPSFVIYDEAIFGALFIRPGFSAYYFGDYFEARYTRFGYRSWIDIRIGGGYDPLYGYYRHAYASNPTWSITIGNLYAGRYRGDIPRPPRTLVQQNVVVNNITNNTTVINNVNNVKNVTMVAPLSKVDKTAVTALKPVTAAEQKQAVQLTKEVKQASIQRVKLETQAAVSQPKPVAGQPVQPFSLQLQKTTVVNSKPSTPPPPAPTQTKEAPKDQSKATVQPKEQPKTLTPQPKETPKSPPPLPKDQPKETPKNPPPLPKDQPKETPKSPPPLPKTPPPLPKEQPKSKDQPKSPPPLAFETQPQAQPKAPAPPPPPPTPTPTPQPKAPPPQTPPQHKTPPPQQKEKEKEKERPKSDRPA